MFAAVVQRQISLLVHIAAGLSTTVSMMKMWPSRAKTVCTFV